MNSLPQKILKNLELSDEEMESGALGNGNNEDVIQSAYLNWDGELCYRNQLRNQRLFELSWDVKRFWIYEIRDNIEKCIDEIKQWLEEGDV